ncbi:hypothetical protein KWG64_06065 [Rahnella sp. PD12R]|uniref:hypothetical protein n=1 Tax=Rahnella sp. PD12R TaxID=2855688 RepID=UPI001C4963F1|nr:hypothetical protein [Rahnella sp. PD12R]MBV6817504.1 hypothetical protein [Rahnella sp. PD12R]
MKPALALALAMLLLPQISNAAHLKVGGNAELKDGGWVCRSLDKAIASREIEETAIAGGKADVSQLNNGSCISYSVRPFKVVAYENYLLPAYPEKGKLFVAVIEPRSGEKWYAYKAFLQSID